MNLLPRLVHWAAIRHASGTLGLTQGKLLQQTQLSLNATHGLCYTDWGVGGAGLPVLLGGIKTL